VRAFAVWLSVRRAFWSDMHAPMQHALAQTILDHLRGDQQLAELAIVRRYARVSPTDLDGTDKLAAELLKGTLQYMTLEALQRCIRRLAENGRVEAARKHYKALSTARYDEDSADDKAAQQLAALKAINAAQKLKPAHDALKEWFLATPAVKELPGQTVPEPFQTDWSPDLPDAERLQLYRQQVEQGRWPREDLSFWFDAAGALPRDARQVDSSLAMFRIALEKAPDDETRAELIDDAGSVVDTDDPPTLARLEEVLKAWRGRADQPESQDALRLFDLHMRLRTGQETDLFATLATLQTPRRQAAARNAVLVALVSRGDKTGARRLIDQIDPDQLLGRGMIDDALHAYRLLGLKDELELATDQLRQHLEDDLLTAWMIPHGDTAGRVIHLALQLEDASLVPEAFSKHLRSTLRDPHEKHLFEAKDAYLRRDWQTAATAAARGIEVFPTLYDYHYFLGMAQARLGQKPEAIATLKTFLKYDHNSHQASQATQKLAELEK
jgi:tetratricopeptide (TPR) repeat protein